MIIEVDHSKLTDTASAIRNYTALQEKEMNSAHSNILPLFSAWQGYDAMNYRGVWNSIIDKSTSYSASLKKSLELYAEIIDSCAKIYKDAQAEIINYSLLI